MCTLLYGVRVKLKKTNKLVMKTGGAISDEYGRGGVEIFQSNCNNFCHVSKKNPQTFYCLPDEVLCSINSFWMLFIDCCLQFI